MKSTSVILPCLIALNLVWSPATRAQSYLPMAIEDATWIMGYGLESYTYYIHFAYKLQGDSLYQGETYKKVYLWDLDDNTDPPYQIVDHQLVGLMRDDTTERKVYGAFFSYLFEMVGCASPQSEEVLLYDFSLLTGDTLRDCFTDEEGTHFEIEGIDTAFAYDRERRIWYVEGNPLITEGVGNKHGLFALSNPAVHAAEGPVLFDYCVGTNFECGLHTATITPKESEIVDIRPNPVHDVININSEFLFSSADIFSCTGILIDQYIPGPSQTIPVSDLSPGLYFIRLDGPSNKHFVSRILKY